MDSSGAAAIRPGSTRLRTYSPSGDVKLRDRIPHSRATNGIDPTSGGFGFGFQCASQEIANGTCNLRMMRFNREMSSVEELNLGVGNVPLESFGTGRKKERIVLAPHGQQWRPLIAEVRLKLRDTVQRCSHSPVRG